MFRKKKQGNSDRWAAVEICHSELNVAIFQKNSQATIVETHSITWREADAKAALDQGQPELAAALKQLASAFKLHGAPLYVALNGDYCVTRVATGASDRVRHELAELEQRSSLYLSLGHGKKAVGGSVHQLDARHQHALLTVVNQRTLDAIIKSVSAVGLPLETVEPALVSICRLVGEMGADKEEPELIVYLTEQGVELGISHEGRLILDYCPARRDARQCAASVVTENLYRLERYCQRFTRLKMPKLRHVILCGDAAAVEAAKGEFRKQKDLIVEALEPATIAGKWTFAESPGPKFGPVIGAGLPPISETAVSGPNLMERIKAESRPPLGLSLRKALWPVAAMLLVAAAGWGIVYHQNGVCAGMEAELAKFESTRSQARKLMGDSVRSQKKADHLQTIAENMTDSPWSEILSTISQCLPEDVWLNSIAFSEGGVATLSGVSYSDDGAFELVRWLQQYPRLRQVALQGTQSVRLPTGPATRFDVVFEMKSLEENNDGNS